MEKDTIGGQRAWPVAAGALGTLARRIEQTGHSGLRLWTGLAARALAVVQATVRRLTHRSELRALRLKGQLDEILADGHVSATEAKALKREVGPGLLRIAQDCHDASEVVS